MVEKKSAVSALSALDVSLEEAQEALRSIEEISGRKDGRICICGHSNGRHSFESGITSCQAAKQACPCKEKRLVASCTDTRSFLKKTQGAGALHALVQGIVLAEERGFSVEWLVDLVCDKCGQERVVLPAPITKQGLIANAPTGVDKFLCRDCRLELQ